MIKQDDVLAALEEPLSQLSLKQRLDPGNRSTDALQHVLMCMRSEGKVKFDINTGRWSKA